MTPAQKQDLKDKCAHIKETTASFVTRLHALKTKLATKANKTSNPALDEIGRGANDLLVKLDAYQKGKA